MAHPQQENQAEGVPCGNLVSPSLSWLRYADGELAQAVLVQGGHINMGESLCYDLQMY